MNKFFTLITLSILASSLFACTTELKSEVLNLSSENSTLSVQDCLDMAELVDRDMGNDCLSNLAVDLNDKRVCDLIEDDQKLQEKCLTDLVQ